jgi:hypothetical protein
MRPLDPVCAIDECCLPEAPLLLVNLIPHTCCRGRGSEWGGGRLACELWVWDGREMRTIKEQRTIDREVNEPEWRRAVEGVRIAVRPRAIPWLSVLHGGASTQLPKELVAEKLGLPRVAARCASDPYKRPWTWIVCVYAGESHGAWCAYRRGADPRPRPRR